MSTSDRKICGYAVAVWLGEIVLASLASFVGFSQLGTHNDCSGMSAVFCVLVKRVLSVGLRTYSVQLCLLLSCQLREFSGALAIL